MLAVGAICTSFAFASEPPPMVAIVCMLKGDDLYKSCDTAESRYRAAGYEVARVDAPQFQGASLLRQRVQRAKAPLIHVIGHGNVDDKGLHKLSYGKDKAKQGVHSLTVVQEIQRVNPTAQTLLEACHSGAIHDDMARYGLSGCVGSTCRTDEQSPADYRTDRETRQTVWAEGVISKYLIDLLEGSSRDFKFWSGDKCVISGEALRNYLSFRMSPFSTELVCQVEAFERDGKQNRPAVQVRADEKKCDESIEKLGKAPSVQLRVSTKYELQAKCAGYKPGEVLRLFGKFGSVKEAQDLLSGKRRNEEPGEIKWTDHVSYSPYDLAGRGCEVVPGYFARIQTVAVDFRASRDGEPTKIFWGDSLRGGTRKMVMPFIADWEAGIPDSRINRRERERDTGVIVFGEGDAKPRAPAGRTTVDGIATPNLGALTLRHARCTEGPEPRPVRAGAGLSFREMDMLKERPAH